MVAGAAVKYQIDGKHDLKDQQEILMNIADMLIELFVCESVLLRIQKLASRSSVEDMTHHSAILSILMHDAQSRISKSATDALISFATGDELKIMLMGIKRFTRYPAVNVVALRRKIADKAIQANNYNY